jgi:hypothetical protein
MVDWDRVEELRNKGWDWDRIADDSKVAYQAPRGVTDKGRALRSLYAKRARTASRESKAEEPKVTQRPDKKPKWTITRVGMLLTPLFGIWFVIAYFIPSPVGVFISAIPDLGIALAASAFLLAFGLLRSEKKWSTVFRGAVVSGIVIGLLLTAVFGISGIFLGYPTLTASCNPSQDGFHQCGNPLWTSGGKPVYFFYGSAACPYCSASSWAMAYALEQFGNLTGYSYTYSSPTDPAGPNTPETLLAYASLSSSYISMQVDESPYTPSIQLPGFSNEYQNAYFVAYDAASGIPFIVIGGHFYTVGTLVSPSTLAGMTTTAVQSAIDSQSGAVWSAVSSAADWLIAFILHVDGGVPGSLLTGNVLTDYNAI